jgi:hypothetical protein
MLSAEQRQAAERAVETTEKRRNAHMIYEYEEHSFSPWR